MISHFKTVALLPLLASPMLAQTLPEGPEPNSSTLMATHYLLGQQAYGTISPAGDKDWWQVILTEPADLRAMTAPGFGADVKVAWVTLLDAGGVPMPFSSVYYPGRGFYSQLTASNLAVGVYYIEVSGFGTATGGYTLDIYSTPVGHLVPSNIVTEAAEPNDPRLAGGVATSSLLWARNTGNLAVGAGGFTFADAASDYDFYEFAVTAADMPVRLSTLATATLPTTTRSRDTCLFLVDPAMTVLASSDDFGGTLWSQFDYRVAAPGTYYAVVKCWGATDTGNYLLDVTGSINATFTARPGGCPGTAGVPSLDTRADSRFGMHMELPLLGTEFCVDVTRLPSNAAMFKVVGLVPLAAPFNLGPLGAPGCFVEVDKISNTLAVADMNGVYFWPTSIPYNLAILGLPLEMQVAVLDFGANPLNLTVSNRGSVVVGNNY